MKKYHLYVHRRKTDNKVFYVGKGTAHRSRSKYNRNRHWHCVVNKHGFYEQIIQSFDKHADAYEAEIALIRLIGIDNLCNVTPGGEGGIGARPGKDHPMYGRKGKDSPRFGKKHTKEQRENISRGRKDGRPNSMRKEEREKLRQRMIGNQYSKGLKHTEESKIKIGQASSGKNNPSYNPQVIKFIHDDGRVFVGTRSEFFEFSDVSRGNLSSIITGRLKKTKGWRVEMADEV